MKSRFCRFLGNEGPVLAAGVMSGTSGDGVTVAIVEITRVPSGRPPAAVAPPRAEPGGKAAAERGGRERGGGDGEQAESEERAASRPGRMESSGLSWAGAVGDGPGFFSNNDLPKIALVHHVTVPYEPSLKARLFDLFDPKTARLDEICRLNFLLVGEFARAVRRCAEEAGVDLSQLSLIGSHGQTICHLPPAAEDLPGGVPSTLQIGDVSVLAQQTGVTCVGNFRARDMAAGGEGAPLVPICDWLLFRSEKATRVVQNIGGIANMTVLPKGSGPEGVFACDTGPGNMVIDEAVRIVTGGQEELDKDGLRAARGKVDQELVFRWLEEPFFHLPPPKSTGRELFGREQAHRYVAEAQRRGLAADDLIATVSELTVQSIVLHYRRLVPGLDEVIVGGGGAKNRYLLNRLAEELGVPVRTHEAYGIPSEAKEAMAFALLAYLTVSLLPGNLPGATGASTPVVLGVVAPGRVDESEKTV